MDENEKDTAMVFVDAALAAEPEPEKDEAEALAAFRRLRAKFEPSEVGLLPRPIDKNDQQKFQCRQEVGNKVSVDGKFCGGYHSRAVHLDFAGHAAVTNRLLQVDPYWSWEPMALDQYGLPLIANGALWIRLTVLGVTRIGYGDAPGKSGVVKELIGDAIRNAAMRFGVGLDLWHKGELADWEDERGDAPKHAPAQPPQQAAAQPPSQRPHAASRAAEGGGQAQGGAPAAASAGESLQRAAQTAPASRDWVAAVSEVGSAEEGRRLYHQAKAAGELAAALTVDGKVTTVGAYIVSWGAALDKAEKEREAARKRLQRVADATDPEAGMTPYDENEPI